MIEWERDGNNMRTMKAFGGQHMKIFAKRDIFTRSRIIKGLSQRELASRSALSHAYISMIERGEKSVGPATAKRLSELLEKHVEELFNIE